MVLNLQNKKVIINEVREVAKQSLSAVIADYRGVSVQEIDKLRQKSRKESVYLRVIRNSLISRIIKKTPYECLSKALIGPTLVAFSKKHPGAAARLFKEFAKENAKFKIKAAAFEGEFIKASEIDRLASILTHKEAIVQLMLTMKEAAAGRFVRTLLALSHQKKAT